MTILIQDWNRLLRRVDETHPHYAGEDVDDDGERDRRREWLGIEDDDEDEDDDERPFGTAPRKGEFGYRGPEGLDPPRRGEFGYSGRKKPDDLGY